MVKTTFASWVIGGWITAVATIAVVSMALGANPSTTTLLVALGVAPGIVIVLLGNDAPLTVAQILHAVETKDGRSRDGQLGADAHAQPVAERDAPMMQ